MFRTLVRLIAPTFRRNFAYSADFRDEHYAKFATIYLTDASEGESKIMLVHFNDGGKSYYFLSIDSLQAMMSACQDIMRLKDVQAGPAMTPGDISSER